MQDSPILKAETPSKCKICGKKIASPEDVDWKTSQEKLFRRHRRTHYKWSDVNFGPDDDPTIKENTDTKQEELPEEAQIDTKEFEITFYDEHVEVVKVEASNKVEAKRIAEDIRTFDGEILDTIHTEKREVSDSSQASEEYLRRMGLIQEEN